MPGTEVVPPPIITVIVVEFTKVKNAGSTATPFMLGTDMFVKFDPVSVTVTDDDVAAMVAGEMLERIGARTFGTVTHVSFERGDSPEAFSEVTW